jgi:hypothetical protein
MDGNIIGINPVSASSYDGCVSLCVAQGSACVGITFGKFGGSDLQCYLKRKMSPASPAPAYIVDSAIRMTGPNGVSQSLLTNGKFDTGDLAAWRSQGGAQYSVEQGAA